MSGGATAAARTHAIYAMETYERHYARCRVHEHRDCDTCARLLTEVIRTDREARG